MGHLEMHSPHFFPPFSFAPQRAGKGTWPRYLGAWFCAARAQVPWKIPAVVTVNHVQFITSRGGRALG